MTVTRGCEYRHADDVVACELEGGNALLDLSTSNYFKINETAASIWEWIGSGATIDKLVNNMLALYDVDEEVCRQDVEAILASFESAGLVRS